MWKAKGPEKLHADSEGYDSADAQMLTRFSEGFVH